MSGPVCLRPDCGYRLLYPSYVFFVSLMCRAHMPLVTEQIALLLSKVDNQVCSYWLEIFNCVLRLLVQGKHRNGFSPFTKQF